MSAMTHIMTANDFHRGEAWHRLRREDFSQVQFEASSELWELLKSMMRAAPALRIGIALVDTHPVVVRARRAMERMRTMYGSVTSSFTAFRTVTAIAQKAT